ncbi:MAG: NADP-dependent malic enzyme [Longimicrobiales bacterium]|nr:NADP-dependent malic enzyme [Longimicrobiales bacterium]
MSDDRHDALSYHELPRPGKIEIVSTKPVATARDLSLAYSPGVAEPCREIHSNPDDVFRYTARGNLVAVVSNGTAVLGLGDIGPLASKPVMEGKGVLFKRFAGIDVFDLEINATDPEDVIAFCRMLEPTVGGINLEDISAPACFVIEERLKAELDIPVFHDDQHGTAIIGGAAVINALEIVKKEIGEVRVVFSGAGASAMATATHLTRLGAQRDHIVLCDSKGVIHPGRDEAMDEYKSAWANEAGGARTLTEALEGADIFIGLSVGGVVSREMIAGMAKDPIIFALANPDPEILPEDAIAERPDAIIATGRSDYPNQVNNVLGFPFIFRGALDVRARGVNAEMMLAATHALAALARADVPANVVDAYGGENLHFGRTYLIPKPFDHRVLFHLAPAVAEAAMETGLARQEIDLDEYRDRLRASLGPGREVMRWMTQRARRRSARIVFPEGHNDIIIRAAAQMVEEGVCRPVLLGRPPRIEEKAEGMGVSLDGVEIHYAAEDSETRYAFADELFARRARKGLTLAEARWNMYKPIYFASAMVRAGEADAVVAGIEANYPEVLRPALEVIGTAEGVRRVAGLYMLAFPNRDLLFFADTTVNIAPDAEALSDIALLSARFVEELGITPRIAMVSFSNFGSVRHPEAEKVAEAVQLVRERAPELEIDGEMQADTAVDLRKLREVYPFSNLAEPANVLVFSSLSAANVAYKLLDRLGRAEVIGPVLMGMDRPVHVLQRGASQQEVLNLATVAAVEAQARD